MKLFSQQGTAIMILVILIFSFITMLFVLGQNQKVKSAIAKVSSKSKTEDKADAPANEVVGNANLAK